MHACMYVPLAQLPFQHWETGASRGGGDEEAAGAGVVRWSAIETASE